MMELGTAIMKSLKELIKIVYRMILSWFKSTDLTQE